MRTNHLSFALVPLVHQVVQAAPSYTLASSTFDRTAWQTQPFVSNGYIGARIPAEGMGYSEVMPVNASGHVGTNGWPLFDPRFTASMVAGFYDQQAETAGTNFAQTGGEQPISTLPTWTSLYLTYNGSTFNNATPVDQISNWTQTASIEDGIIETSFSWSPMNGTILNLRYTIFAHRTIPNLGVVRLDVNGMPSGGVASVTDVLDGVGAWRTTPISSGVDANYSNIISSAVSPNGISNVTAYIYSTASLYSSPNQSLSTAPLSLLPNITASQGCFAVNAVNSTASQCYSSTTPSTGSFTVVKYVGIATSDAYNGSARQTALDTVLSAAATTYDALLASHMSAWASIWAESDIIIPGDDELQLATRASLFYLLTNVREGTEGAGLGDNSIAPAGLTSDSYAGQIFWDADIWMYPSLLALYPSYAESINNYRLKNHGAAQENAQQFNRSGALYPWTGARFGNCTGVGPCYNYEYHLNNDIAVAHYQYYAATKNVTWLREKGWPVISTVAEFWASQVVYNSTTLSYDTLNETDPDEYACTPFPFATSSFFAVRADALFYHSSVNNAAYTNAGITVVLHQAIELAAVLNITVPSNWSNIASNITILTDSASGITLEYDGFNGSTSVKQADVVLLPYPLEYPQPATQALEDLDFYAGATSANGPGMTYSVFSIDSSALDTVGCASYTYLLQASQPYSRAPFYQFSEQTSDNYSTNGGTNPAFTFLTGHGGFLQSFTHGFTGYRSRANAFYLNPSLPPQIANYTVRGMKWQGGTFDIALSTATTSITLRNSTGNSTIVVEIGSRNSRGGNYTMTVGKTITVPTIITNNTLVNGNVAQCATSLVADTGFNVSTPGIVAGQYALAAIDGSNATAWQPLLNTSSTLSVDLGTIRNVSVLHFNWGKNPPISFIVNAGVNVNNLTQVLNGTITISAPYNASTINEVVTRIGNVSDYALASPLSARYVNLSITGSFLGDGAGGTVSEMAVLSNSTASSSGNSTATTSANSTLAR